MALAKRVIAFAWPWWPREQPGAKPQRLSQEEGYDIEVVVEGATPAFTPPTLRTGLAEAADVPLTLGPNGTRYVAHVRARTWFGLVSETDSARIPLVVDGGELVARPERPTTVRATALADGDVEVTWQHYDSDGAASAASFKIYTDNGTGTVDTVTPAGTATQYRRRAVLSGLAADVRHLVVVQAFSSAGIGDGNLAADLVVPRNSPPPALSEVLAEQV